MSVGILISAGTCDLAHNIWGESIIGDNAMVRIGWANGEGHLARLGEETCFSSRIALVPCGVSHLLFFYSFTTIERHSHCNRTIVLDRKRIRSSLWDYFEENERSGAPAIRENTKMKRNKVSGNFRPLRIHSPAVNNFHVSGLIAFIRLVFCGADWKRNILLQLLSLCPRRIWSKLITCLITRSS